MNSAGVTDTINSWSITGAYGAYIAVSPTTYPAILTSNVVSYPNQALYPLWTTQGATNLPNGIPWTQPVLTPGGSTSISTPTSGNNKPGSGAAIEVSSESVTAAQLQSLYTGWVTGQVYNIVDTFSGSVAINFAQAGAVTEPVQTSNGASTIWGSFQVEYISSSTFEVTGAFAYSVKTFCFFFPKIFQGKTLMLKHIKIR